MLNNSLAKPQRIIRKEPLILVVEDNLFYATAILELSYYQFFKASNGRIGIDIAMDSYPI